MITYLYWIGLFLLTGALMFGLGFKAKLWKTALAGTLAIFVVGWAAYTFHLEQIFVKRYGGEMSVRTPEGQYHMGITWKDDNIWIETYDPKTDTCIFSEYSKGNLLQGRVFIKKCNPIQYRQ